MFFALESAFCASDTFLESSTTRLKVEAPAAIKRLPRVDRELLLARSNMKLR